MCAMCVARVFFPIYTIFISLFTYFHSSYGSVATCVCRGIAVVDNNNIYIYIYEMKWRKKIRKNFEEKRMDVRVTEQTHAHKRPLYVRSIFSTYSGMTNGTHFFFYFFRWFGWIHKTERANWWTAANEMKNKKKKNSFAHTYAFFRLSF